MLNLYLLNKYNIIIIINEREKGEREDYKE
jgi:hypothetical protein